MLRATGLAKSYPAPAGAPLPGPGGGGRWVGFVFQAFLLVPSLTALENVLLAARYAGRPAAEARRRALALLEELGVGDRRDHYPAQLSGGAQQRVAWGRAGLDD